MFYSYEILRKRGGKFGIIWLAATNPKYVNKRELIAVNISRLCDDVEGYICQRMPGTVVRSSDRLSLYLSSQLMYGLSVVCRKQHDLLLGDIQTLRERLFSWRLIEPNISLPFQRASVTLDDSRLFEVDPNFGEMKESMMSPMLPDTEYFVVMSPRSTPEGSIARSIPLPAAEDEELQHIAPHEVITLPEIPYEVHAEEEMMEGAPDLPALDLDDFDLPPPPCPSAPFPPFPSPPVIPTEPVTSQIPDGSMGISPELPEVTPAVERDIKEPKRPEKRSFPPESIDVTVLPGAGPLPTSPPRGARRRVIEVNEFELGEVVGPVRRPRRIRRRRIVIDAEMQISREEMRNRILRSEERGRMEVDIPILKPSVEELFTRPGSRVLGKNLKRRWGYLKSFPVPNDSALPGSYCAVYEEASYAPSEEPRLERALERSEAADATQVQLEELEDVEVPREVEVSGQVTVPSLREITIPTPDISAIQPLRLSVQAEPTKDLMRPVTDAEEVEVAEFLEEPPRELFPSRISEYLAEPPIELPSGKTECRVSPIRTPPPPSPEVIRPISPSVEKVARMILDALSTRDAEQITFKELVPPQKYNRVFAANTFVQLLALHERGDIILHQEESGDILINRNEF